MALVRPELKNVSRGESQRSVVAAAAYRAGERLWDERRGQHWDYSRKADVVHKEVLTPEGAPDWASNREALWNAVEANEKRKDARLARDWTLMFPRGLNLEQEAELVRGFVQKEFVRFGYAVDLCIHHGKASDGENHPHAHVLITDRQFANGEWSPKKDRSFISWDDSTVLKEWRNKWQIHVNDALKRAGSDERVDLRSLAEQRKEALERGDMQRAGELDRKPAVPLGPAGHAKQPERYTDPEYGDWAARVAANEDIQHRNEAKRFLNWQSQRGASVAHIEHTRRVISQAPSWAPEQLEILPPEDWGVMRHDA